MENCELVHPNLFGRSNTFGDAIDRIRSSSVLLVSQGVDRGSSARLCCFILWWNWTGFRCCFEPRPDALGNLEQNAPMLSHPSSPTVVDQRSESLKIVDFLCRSLKRRSRRFLGEHLTINESWGRRKSYSQEEYVRRRFVVKCHRISGINNHRLMIK